MCADDIVAVILQQPDGAAQHLVVSAGDDVPHLLAVAHERVGAEQCRPGRLDGADQRDEDGRQASSVARIPLMSRRSTTAWARRRMEGSTNPRMARIR